MEKNLNNKCFICFKGACERASGDEGWAVGPQLHSSLYLILWKRRDGLGWQAAPSSSLICGSCLAGRIYPEPTLAAPACPTSG